MVVTVVISETLTNRFVSVCILSVLCSCCMSLIVLVMVIVVLMESEWECGSR